MGSKDEHDYFGAMVGTLMKKVPEEKVDSLRIEILSLIQEAKK